MNDLTKKKEEVEKTQIPDTIHDQISSTSTNFDFSTHIAAFKTKRPCGIVFASRTLPNLPRTDINFNVFLVHIYNKTILTLHG